MTDDGWQIADNSSEQWKMDNAQLTMDPEQILFYLRLSA